MTIKIKHKRGTASAVASANPTPAAGELVFETDTRRFKLGDGSTAYSSLSYVTPYVTATDKLLGRSSAGAGSAEEITCTSFGRSLIDDADAAAARTTLSVQPTASPAFTGAISLINSGASDNSTIRYGNSGQDWYVGLRGDTSNAFAIADSVAFRLTISSTGTATFAGQIVGQAGAAITGSVGINVTPTQKLHVHEGSGADVYARITNTDSGSSTGLLLGLNGNEEGVIRVEVNKPLYIDTNNTTRLTISSTGTATFAGQVLVTAGSVSACSVAPSGDPNTGLFFPAADVAAIATNGVERVRVDASGNVGIGTSPLEKLHVVRSGSGVLANFSDAATQTLHVGVVASAGMYLDNPNGGYIYLRISGNNRLQLGADGSLTCSEVYGDTVGATNRDLFIDSTGLIGYVSSIRESKTDIASLNDVSWLSALSPVSYRYRKRNADGTYSDEADGVTDYGLIAEDVEAVRPELCFYDVVDGEPQLRGVTYSKLITPMLKYIQQLEARIAALEEKINA